MNQSSEALAWIKIFIDRQRRRSVLAVGSLVVERLTLSDLRLHEKK